jgi:hypothetical protein
LKDYYRPLGSDTAIELLLFILGLQAMIQITISTFFRSLRYLRVSRVTVVLSAFVIPVQDLMSFDGCVKSSPTEVEMMTS